jgi:uncharacterized protein (TIGR03086 family)
MLINVPDLRSADAVAVRASIDVVGRISPADLDRPTPCADWRLRDLLTHMTEQHHVFAAAASGAATAPQADHSVRGYALAAEEALAAFAPDDVLDREVVLPEAPGPIPGRLAISFHLVDYVVHGWDVARSLDLPWDLPQDVLRQALPIAEMVPDDASRLSPGAPFAPRLPAPPGDDLLDRLLTLLGRSPDR